MWDFTKYGFKNQSKFLKATNVPREIFDAMSKDVWKPFGRSVLLHPECPLDIRDTFAKDPIWYKRTVAYFATKAPADYYLKASGETDKRIKRFFDRTHNARTYVEGKEA